jgi:molybdenum cofactor synthesis domain-containing protein
LISIDEALDRIAQTTRPLEETESIPLSEASGRILAQDIRSEVLVPPFARSAMDGYAVKAADTVGTSRYDPLGFTLGEKIHAGSMPEQEVVPGTCAQIATGAPIPAGADAVVKVEDTEEKDGVIAIRKTLYPGENVAPAGEDIRPGDALLFAGTVLTPSRIGVTAALGIERVEVFRKPRALIFTTGDEIQPLGEPLEPGKVYDINSFTLGALLDQAGVDWEKGGNVTDDPEAIRKALGRSRDFDLLLFSGGSSAGERDLLVDILGEKGKIIFHGIAIKPGKPTLFGHVGGSLVFGMPGFPASCLAVGYVLLLPCVMKMAQRPAAEGRTRTATLARKIASSLGRHQFFTVRVEEGKAHPVYKESGDITSLSTADGYVEIPPTQELLDAGEEVDVVLF